MEEQKNVKAYMNIDGQQIEVFNVKMDYQPLPFDPDRVKQLNEQLRRAKERVQIFDVKPEHRQETGITIVEGSIAVDENLPVPVNEEEMLGKIAYEAFLKARDNTSQIDDIEAWSQTGEHWRMCWIAAAQAVAEHVLRLQQASVEASE